MSNFDTGSPRNASVPSNPRHSEPHVVDFSGPSRGVTTKADYLYATVRSQILSGQIAPGSRVQQEQLATKLGVSITPLREAIRRLQTEGLVVAEAHKDAIVAPLSDRGLRELFETRMPLDGQAAYLAAERRTEEDLVRVQSTLSALLSTPRADSASVLRVSFDFHRAVWCSSHNEVLIGVLESLWARSERYRRLGALVHMHDDNHDPHQKEHAQLAEAIAARDGRSARRIMTRHTQATLNDLSPRLTGPNGGPTDA